MTNPNIFGPGVIGQDAYEENKRKEETGADVFGPGVLDQGEQTAAPAPVSESAEANADDRAAAANGPAEPPFTSLAIAGLAKALEANGADFDRFYEGELARPDGARKGALGVLLSFEQLHQNRPQVVEALTGMLRKKPS